VKIHTTKHEGKIAVIELFVDGGTAQI